MREFCHLQKDQSSFDSGYKKVRGFKFHSITPDGLLSSLAEPFPGPVEDLVVVLFRNCGNLAGFTDKE